MSTSCAAIYTATATGERARCGLAEADRVHCTEWEADCGETRRGRHEFIAPGSREDREQIAKA
jgi:hypothetical protein